MSLVFEVMQIKNTDLLFRKGGSQPMSNITLQEKNQISNILSTLTEATQHLHSLVKQKQFSPCVYAFSSIVEGYQAIQDVLVRSETKKVQDYKNQLERQINLLAGALEKQDFLKMNEVIQFSFLPTMNKLHTSFKVKDEESRPVVIGVFHPQGNPKDFQPEPRTNALLEESRRQNAQLLFFTSDDVDFEKEIVRGFIKEGDEWVQTESAFPDVINNVAGGRRTFAERKLRRMIPFTSFYVGNKFTLPKRLLENRKFTELLVPFVVATDNKQIHRFMEQNERVVFKALKSNRGEDIYFVTKKGQRYSVSEHKNERVYNTVDFDKWLHDIILAEKGSYIVQRFILTRTKANEPYHFRAHVQKDGEGAWGLTHIYPRVGSKKSNLSNVVNQGYVEDFREFMLREFDEKGPEYEQEILRLSLEVAEHIDKLYGFSVDELGLDFAIDDTGRIWMHEANNGPQTAFHEEKRAVHTIAYAKYLAENGIFYDETVRKSQSRVFQAGKSSLPYLEERGRTLLGILSGSL